MSKKIELNIEGMTCNSCAATVTKYLQNRGSKEILVTFATGDGIFTIEDEKAVPDILKGLKDLGYNASLKSGTDQLNVKTKGLSAIEKKFYFSAVLTVPLLLHMFLPFGFLHDPFLQFFLCLPVIVIGAMHFGKSAWGSLKLGVPNMDVLISVGSNAAFLYSIAGTIIFWGTAQAHDYLFFETAATIITLVLLGNVMEHRSVRQTTTAIEELTKLQEVLAKKIVSKINPGGKHEVSEYIEISFSQIKKDDVLLVNSGDKIPVDGTIISGECIVDESMITGESLPVHKTINGQIVGGTILSEGSIRMRADSVGKDTVLSKIIRMVKEAQSSKPEIQRLGDKVSAIFVPVVLGISALTFLVSYFAFDISAQKAIMSSIAVLVISCPCAMGLATPTAVMVGIGRAARKGILIKGGSTVESFSKIKNVVFDKTGTLTTGKFRIKKIHSFSHDENEIKSILYSMELHSSHPIAMSLVNILKPEVSSTVEMVSVKEEKGIGLTATDSAGNEYQAGSYKIADKILKEDIHSIYLLRNNELIGAVDIADELKVDAAKTISLLNSYGLNTIMLSGDNETKCRQIAEELGIKEYYSRQSPEQKIDFIKRKVSEAPTAMVGDGINDAPALAQATTGISISNATQIAIQSAQVVLLNGNELMQIAEGLSISRHTVITIKQNLFWAFFYNVFAIPIAAAGLLNPMFGALAMAFSDVVVIGNSIRLKSKKIN